jgi:CheY-like chemotaxis protein
MHILCVDDNPVNRQVAERLVQSLGHTSETAENGEIAVNRYREGAFDAILMDLQMPVMDGLDATRQIRKLEESGTTRVPIIAVTANAMLGDDQICLAAGMDFYLPKPLRREALMLGLEQVSGTASSSPVAAISASPAEIDWEQFDEVMEPGDPECAEIFQEFCQLCEEGIREIAQHSTVGDARNLAALSHQQKGSALTFGLTALATLFFEAENTGTAEALPLRQEWEEAALTCLTSAIALVRSARNITV